MKAAPTDRVTPLLKQRIRGAFKRLPGALTGHEEDIHQMRVAGRRLRVALPLLAHQPQGRRVQRSRRILRQLTRTGGLGRDLDVAVALFEERLSAQGTALDPQAKVLRRRLKAARTRSRSRLIENVLDLEIATLRRHLRALVRQKGEGLFTVFRRLRDEREAQATEALDMLRILGSRFEPVMLHGVRRRARQLRYTAELSEVLRGQESPAVAEFKGLQDQLGALHDTFVLSEWFAAQATAARRRGQTELAAEAEAQRDWFLQKARGHHRDFLASNPAAVIRRGLATLGRSRSVA